MSEAVKWNSSGEPVLYRCSIHPSSDEFELRKKSRLLHLKLAQATCMGKCRTCELDDESRKIPKYSAVEPIVDEDGKTVSEIQYVETNEGVCSILSKGATLHSKDLNNLVVHPEAEYVQAEIIPPRM